MSRLFLISVGLGMFLASYAFAQPMACRSTEALHAQLADDYGERRVSGGLQNQSAVYEVWVNDETGTWSILRTTSNGRSCLMASGTHYREFAAEPSGLPS